MDQKADFLLPESQPLLRQEDRLDLGFETYNRDLTPPRKKKRAAKHPAGFRVLDF